MLEPPACAAMSTMTLTTIPKPKPTPIAAGAVHGAHGGSSAPRLAGSGDAWGAGEPAGENDDCVEGGGTLGIGLPEVTRAKRASRWLAHADKKISGRAQFHLSPPGAGQGSGGAVP